MNQNKIANVPAIPQGAPIRIYSETYRFKKKDINDFIAKLIKEGKAVLVK